MNRDIPRIRGNEYTAFCPKCGRLAHVNEFCPRAPEEPMWITCAACCAKFSIRLVSE